MARGSLISLAGSATSALMGFATTFVVARLLGETGAGVVFQAIAVFGIVVSLAKFGMDSVAIWLLPRLSDRDVEHVRSGLLIILSSAAILGAVGALLVVVVSPHLFARGPQGRELAHAVALLGWFVPVGGLTLVLLAATRGLGALMPYVLIGNFGLPVLRPLLIAVVAMSGGTAAAVTLAWAAPLPLAAVAAFLCVRLQVLRLERQARVAPRYRPHPGQVSTIGRFALPRTVSAALDQSLDWMQVLVVGALAGTAAAGIYGGASRFIAAGLIVDTAIRAVVSPRFSALLHADRLAEVQDLYRTVTSWLILFSCPIYLVLGTYAATALGWLGEGFVVGETMLVILCVGATVTILAGNVHTVLLMSGRSGWAAINKAVAVVVCLSLNLALVPVLGIEGAGIAWAVSVLLDATLALVEVRVFLGVKLEVTWVLYALAVPVVTVGLTGWLIKVLLGGNVGSLVLTLVVGGLLFLTWCAVDRRRLRLDSVSQVAHRA